MLYFILTLVFYVLQFAPSTYGQSQNSYSVNPQYQAVSQPQHMPPVHSGTQQWGSANQNSVPVSQGMQTGQQSTVGFASAPVRILSILNFFHRFYCRNLLKQFSFLHFIWSCCNYCICCCHSGRLLKLTFHFFCI